MSVNHLKLVEAAEQKERDHVEVCRDVAQWVDEQNEKRAKKFEMARSDADFLLNHMAVEQNHMRLAETVM